MISGSCRKEKQKEKDEKQKDDIESAFTPNPHRTTPGKPRAFRLNLDLEEREDIFHTYKTVAHDFKK